MNQAVSRYLQELHQTSLEQVQGARQAPQQVAFFDLDRTIIAGYSLTALAREKLRTRQLSAHQVLSLVWVFIRYGLGRCDYQGMLQAVVDSIKGMHEDDLKALGRCAFDRQLSKKVYQEAQGLICAHRKRGHAVVMVTAATRYQAEPIAEMLGIDDVCCTELEIVDGQVSGRVAACYGVGKLNAAKTFCKNSDATLANAYFYTDSQDDLPLLEQVGHPVVVNGKRELIKVGEDKGWPSLQFQETHFDFNQAA